MAANDLQFVYQDGVAASQEELAALHARFPNLPDAYLQCLCNPSRHHLKIIDRDERQSYDLCSVPEALENHEAYLSWFDFDEDEQEEMLARIREENDAEFDYRSMLPIVSSAASSDYLLLRVDDSPFAGRVYLWSHEECMFYGEFAGSADQVFPALEHEARRGNLIAL